MKVTIEVDERLLNALEDALTAWNICKKHKMLSSEIETAVRSVDCKACVKEHDRILAMAMLVESRLWEQFLKNNEETSG